jgi:hypothetical protein
MMRIYFVKTQIKKQIFKYYIKLKKFKNTQITSIKTVSKIRFFICVFAIANPFYPRTIKAQNSKQ